MNHLFLEKAKELTKEFNVKGVIIIAQKLEHDGLNIGQFGLTHEEVRESLSIATYYNEKINIDSETEPEAN